MMRISEVNTQQTYRNNSKNHRMERFKEIQSNRLKKKRKINHKKIINHKNLKSQLEISPKEVINLVVVIRRDGNE